MIFRNRSTLPRTLRLTAALALVTVGAAACGDDDEPTNNNGTRYNLTSVTAQGTTDNSAPFLTQDGTIPEFGTYHFEIEGATVELLSGNRYRATLDLDATLNGAPFPGLTDVTETGSYTQSGTTITFNPDDAGEENYTATISGTTITGTELFPDPETGEDMTVTMVFTRQ